MPELRLDPEYWRATASLRAGQRPPPWKNVSEFREFMNNLMSMIMSATPSSPDVKKEVFTIKSYDGAEITITRFANDNVLKATEPTPAVIYDHGGGMVACTIDIFAPQIALRADHSNLPFFAVSYRLAPEHPAPAGVEDFYAALKYVSEHAKELNVDASKIAVMGDSVGGGIAASTALLARDRQLEPPLAKQILIYPMLDDRTELAPDAPITKLMGWQPNDNFLAWNAYIGEDKREKPDADIPSHAVPARAKSLRGLPPTYMDVGTLDLFRDEDIAYVQQLLKDDIEVEFHLWPGLPHGFDGVLGTSWAGSATEARLNAMKRIGV